MKAPQIEHGALERHAAPPVLLHTDEHAHVERLVEEVQVDAACRGRLLTPREAVAALMLELATYRATLPPE